jgi:NifU-like domain
MAENQDFQQRIARIEALTRSLEGTSDPAVRALVKELTQSVMELHGAGIQRLLELVYESGPQASATIKSFGKDPLVGSILILYGLHPLDLETRVGQAMDALAPTFRKHHAEVELIGVDDAVVRLKIGAAPNSASGRAVKSAIEEQIYAIAPDVMRIEGLGALGASDLVGIEPFISHGLNGTTAVAAGKGRD